jgi:hypothetical protein
LLGKALRQYFRQETGKAFEGCDFRGMRLMDLYQAALIAVVAIAILEIFFPEDEN